MLKWNWSGHVTADLLGFDEGLLPSARAAEVDRHLKDCSRCAQQLRAIRDARETLRAELRPYAMPEQMSDAIRQAIVSGSPESLGTSSKSPGAVARSPDSGFALAGSHAWAVASIAIVLVAGAWWQAGRPWIGLRDSSVPPLAFERAARTLHEHAAQGGLSLDFESSSPSAIRGWLQERGAPVPNLAIQPADSRMRIRPVGAAVARLRDGSASLVRYEIDGHPVTLMTADADATPGPSASWPLSKQITHRRDGGLDALAWTAGGQTYVLVSDLPGRGTQACLLCHADARFRQAVSRF